MVMTMAKCGYELSSDNKKFVKNVNIVPRYFYHCGDLYEYVDMEEFNKPTYKIERFELFIKEVLQGDLGHIKGYGLHPNVRSSTWKSYELSPVCIGDLGYMLDVSKTERKTPLLIESFLTKLEETMAIVNYDSAFKQDTNSLKDWQEHSKLIQKGNLKTAVKNKAGLIEEIKKKGGFKKI